MDATVWVGDSEIVQAWELKPAKCRCKRCSQFWDGKVPQLFLDIALRDGREDPWWWRTCPACQPAEDQECRAFLERTRPRRKGEAPDGEPVLKRPTEEDPEPTADQEGPPF